MTIQLYLIKKNVYGNDLIYPNCRLSKAITKLLNTKTLNNKHIDILKNDLNYQILFSGIDYLQKDIKNDNTI